jgi:hypothetical protein
VDVGVLEAGQHEATGEVDLCRADRRLELGVRADLLDPTVRHDHPGPRPVPVAVEGGAVAENDCACTHSSPLYVRNP